MKFSTRTTYGLRSMIFLANNFDKKNIALSKIAENENISVKYLEKIFSSLKKNNLVKSERGVSGGYFLNKNPQDITIFEIVEALEGEMLFFHCLDKDGKINCSEKCNCKATLVLIKVQNAVNTSLKSMTLKELTDI